MGPSPSPKPLPNVYFNHLIMVIDQETMKDIKKSRLIKDRFARFDVSTTNADHGQSWTGVYITGKRTYLEFFTPDPKKGFRLGDWGICFSVEVAGGLDPIFRKLKVRFNGQIEKSFRKLRFQGRLVPWQWLAAFKNQESPFNPNFFLVEELRSFMDLKKPPPISKGDEISRERYNREWFAPDRLLLDVVGVTLAMNSIQSQRFLQALSIFGYRIRFSKSGQVCEGPDISFVVTRKEPSKAGVRRIDLTLQRPVRMTMVNRFGENSILKVENREAFWTF